MCLGWSMGGLGRGTALRRVLRRVHALRDRSGQRRRASMALLFDGRGIWLPFNLGQQPLASAATHAAAERGGRAKRVEVLASVLHAASPRFVSIVKSAHCKRPAALD